MTLRLVRDEASAPVVEDPPGGDLREALKPLTEGSVPENWRYVLLAGETEALCRALDHNRLGSWQIEQMVTFLQEVDPLKGREAGAWSQDTLNSYVDEALGRLTIDRWLSDPLARLDRAMRQVVREGGRNFFSRPLLRAAVVKALTTPAHAPSGRATG